MAVASSMGLAIQLAQRGTDETWVGMLSTQPDVDWMADLTGA
jgi:hypothetical protein